ncbi:unnamed protein product [Cylindrotheca closterium]|uniref:Uncharacterized protein n=1 Tax=Cylindrotheca closterium TaxID=2856 RepID=A0AAD2CG75_9STRA|nr:unnamed protein product [Cylindrotheca closterium]
MTYQRISDTHGNSVQDFEDSVDEFICEYNGENPKYQANMYLFDTSNQIRKPYNTKIGIHANCLKTLFMYHDMLPGNCSNVNDENDPAQIRKRKLALFRSFPIDWQGDFINSRNDPANDNNITWKDIVIAQAVEALTKIVLVVVVVMVMVDQAMVINRIQDPRTLQDILKGIHKVFNVEAIPSKKNKEDFSQETPTMVAEAVDSMARAVDAPKLAAFSQDETIKAEANHSNKTVKTTMLSRTTIKKLKALLRKAAFLNGTKTECLMVECKVPSSTSIRNTIIKLKKISNGMINSTLNNKTIILKNRRRRNIFPMMKIRHFPFMKSIADQKYS